MLNNLFQYNLSSNKLKLNLDHILLSMGYSENNIPSGYYELVQNLYFQSLDVINPVCGFKVLPVGEVSTITNGIKLADVEFYTGSKIASRLKNIEGSVVFALTLGCKFEEWVGKFYGNDPFATYAGDLIGSAYVEIFSDWLEKEIENIVGKEFEFSNIYSPGYCNWDISEQVKLFTFLPKHFCGIKLSSYSMMQPKKSLSGIIGYGKDVAKLELPCNLCVDFNCHKNINEKKNRIDDNFE
ncbi:MAG: hypothetical protein L3J41_14055 [Melioribacteraceae bacterium]|nr:hypothetical protein [Melioribacteraceae bacterium]